MWDWVPFVSWAATIGLQRCPEGGVGVEGPPTQPAGSSDLGVAGAPIALGAAPLGLEFRSGRGEGADPGGGCGGGTTWHAASTLKRGWDSDSGSEGGGGGRPKPARKRRVGVGSRVDGSMEVYKWIVCEDGPVPHEWLFPQARVGEGEGGGGHHDPIDPIDPTPHASALRTPPAMSFCVVHVPDFVANCVHPMLDPHPPIPPPPSHPSSTPSFPPLPSLPSGTSARLLSIMRAAVCLGRAPGRECLKFPCPLCTTRSVLLFTCVLLCTLSLLPALCSRRSCSLAAA